MASDTAFTGLYTAHVHQMPNTHTKCAFGVCIGKFGMQYMPRFTIYNMQLKYTATKLIHKGISSVLKSIHIELIPSFLVA